MYWKKKNVDISEKNILGFIFIVIYSFQNFNHFLGHNYVKDVQEICASAPYLKSSGNLLYSGGKCDKNIPNFTHEWHDPYINIGHRVVNKYSAVVAWI